MRTQNAAWLLFSLFIFLGSAWPQDAGAPPLRDADRVRLAEARRLAAEVREQIWPGWSAAPLALLLVTPEHEFLLWHPRPSEDFIRGGHDTLLETTVYYRARKHSPNLLAAFPAVGRVSTIVIGQPENTSAKSSTPWLVTMLHEHFHQWQDSQPGIFAEIEALGLSGGDQTGMWMLNYPFPYDDAAVQEKFSELCRALLKALDARDAESFPRRVTEYVHARKQFTEGLARNDYKYFSFQIWKEGVARYTELRVAELAARAYQPSREFTELADFTGFDAQAARILASIRGDLAAPDLGGRRRVSFYAVGAAEALLLDEFRPGWKQHYRSDKFFLEKSFAD